MLQLCITCKNRNTSSSMDFHKKLFKFLFTVMRYPHYHQDLYQKQQKLVPMKIHGDLKRKRNMPTLIFILALPEVRNPHPKNIPTTWHLLRKTQIVWGLTWGQEQVENIIMRVKVILTLTYIFENARNNISHKLLHCIYMCVCVLSKVNL